MPLGASSPVITRHHPSSPVIKGRLASRGHVGLITRRAWQADEREASLLEDVDRLMAEAENAAAATKNAERAASAEQQNEALETALAEASAKVTALQHRMAASTVARATERKKFGLREVRPTRSAIRCTRSAIGVPLMSTRDSPQTPFPTDALPHSPSPQTPFPSLSGGAPRAGSSSDQRARRPAPRRPTPAHRR